MNSNYGRLTVQLAAPGQEILSTSNSGSFEYKSGTSMAAPMVSGVAALMASVNPRITAGELRGLLLQSAARSSLPVGAGYLDALASAVAATTATSYGNSQAPQLRILRATTKGSKLQLQAALLGSAQAIAPTGQPRRQRVAVLRAGRSPFSVTLRKRGRVARIDALNAAGQVAGQRAAPGGQAAGRQARRGRQRNVGATS